MNVIFRSVSNALKFLSSTGANQPASGGGVEARDVTVGSRPVPKASVEDIEAVKPYFDRAFYTRQYSDVAATCIDPIVHYMQWGWRERRDPSPNFSTGYYLDKYQDISDNDINPFLHYVLFGRFEGRSPKKDSVLRLGFRESATAVGSDIRLISLLPASTASMSPASPLDTSKLDIHWLVPDFSRGGGGHMTIFRIVRLLELLGHKCTIWIFRPHLHLTPDEAYCDIVKYFQCVRAEVKFTYDGVIDASGDALIATGWDTAFAVNAAGSFREKFYFVQDHEPEFYPSGPESVLAKETYSFDLACICAGAWLTELMSDQYGRWSRGFDLAYDHNTYRRSTEREFNNHQVKKLAVYARQGTSRRCVSLALMALELLGAERDDFEVHFFGQEQLPFSEVNYTAYNHGILDAEGLSSLYSQCDIGICFSATNYSLVPQEMMATGLPVVELNGESTRAAFPDGVVLLAGPKPSDIKSAVTSLFDKPDLRKDLGERGWQWVKTLTWERSAEVVESALYERLRAAKSQPTSLIQSKLDVVVPTYNGLGDVTALLSALRKQSMYSEMALYFVDSSSTDGTAEYLRAQSDIKFVSIPVEQFQHGRTRNFGASLGKSPLIAFLTQDAIPASVHWAQDICQMMDHYPDAAGLFGRHIPYPHHSKFVRDEIEVHFRNLLLYPLLVSKETDIDRWNSNDIQWRQNLHYYSDNNSCLRRKVWNEIPYQEVDYGEDQLWADDIIKAGYGKIYAPTATVYHSHDYQPEETFKRAAVEARFFKKYFGYKLISTNFSEVEQLILNQQRAFAAGASIDGFAPEEISSRKAVIAAKYKGWHAGGT